jgi:hypothetical protein
VGMQTALADIVGAVERGQQIVVEPALAEVRHTHGQAEEHVARVRVAAAEVRTAVAAHMIVAAARTVVVDHSVEGVRIVAPTIVRTSSGTAMTRVLPVLSAVYRRVSPLATACHASRTTYL